MEIAVGPTYPSKSSTTTLPTTTPTSRAKMVPIKWEFSPTSAKMVPLVDGAIERAGHEITDAFAVLEGKARRGAVRPKTADPAIVSGVIEGSSPL